MRLFSIRLTSWPVMALILCALLVCLAFGLQEMIWHPGFERLFFLLDHRLSTHRTGIAVWHLGLLIAIGGLWGFRIRRSVRTGRLSAAAAGRICGMVGLMALCLLMADIRLLRMLP